MRSVSFEPGQVVFAQGELGDGMCSLSHLLTFALSERNNAFSL